MVSDEYFAAMGHTSFEGTQQGLVALSEEEGRDLITNAMFVPNVAMVLVAVARELKDVFEGNLE